MTFRSTDFTLQDLAAMLVSLALTFGLIVLAALERDIPSALTMALGSSTTWLFIRSTHPTPTWPTPPQSPLAIPAPDAYYGFIVPPR